MADSNGWQRALNKPFHSLPGDAAFLAPALERPAPKLAHRKAKMCESRTVTGHAVVPDVPAHHSLQPLAHPRDGFVQASLQFGFHLPEFSLAAGNAVGPAHPASVDSIPTSGNKDDFASMGTTAALKLQAIVANVASILAIELLAPCRAVRQARIRLLSSREHNLGRVLCGLVLRHRKSQPA
jgi:hypothetical protein